MTTALNPTQQITIEAWVSLDSYVSGYGTQGDCPVIVGKNWSVAYMLRSCLRRRGPRRGVRQRHAVSSKSST